MEFIGIDPRANKFTRGYRDGHSPPDARKGKRTETFEPNGRGLAAFYRTPAGDGYVPAGAVITMFAFVRLAQPFVKEAIAADTYELKQISRARNNTDKIGL